MPERKMTLNIYRIRQLENRNFGAIGAAVVATTDEDAARHLHPATGESITDWQEVWSEWCKGPQFVEVTWLGVAAPGVEAGLLLNHFVHNE